MLRWRHDRDAMAERRRATLLGALRRGARTPAGRARPPAHAGRAPDSLRLLHTRDAVRDPGPHAAHLGARGPDERDAASFVAGADALGGGGLRGTDTVPGGSTGDERDAHRCGLGQGRPGCAGPRRACAVARPRRTDAGADRAARRDLRSPPDEARPRRPDVRQRGLISVTWGIRGARGLRSVGLDVVDTTERDADRSE
ncbi:hypothetical protein PLANTIT3_50395 [Plantibacter sp. T3]|nr:hypothetical protein PLANTIT3_50395 [Plantibacter sp. T3]